MKRILLSVAVITALSLGFAPTGQGQTEKDDGAARRGFDNYKAGKYDEAIKDFDEAIHLDPEDASNYRNRGIVYSKKGDPAKAIESYSTALAKKPDDIPSHFGRGSARIATGDYKGPSRTWMPWRQPNATTWKPGGSVRSPTRSSTSFPRRSMT